MDNSETSSEASNGTDDDEIVSDNDGINAQNAEFFDTDLPPEHNYLGTMERVSGVQYLEPNKSYRLPIFPHDSIIFPGETMPMILPEQTFTSTDLNDDGLLFGLFFLGLRNGKNNDLYGVTCQVYEKGRDERRDIVSIKSRAHQRFRIKNDRDVPEFYIMNNIRYEEVIILPEIVLPHPLYGFDSSSLFKFRLNETMKAKVLMNQSYLTIWPPFVYRMYDVLDVIERIKTYLSALKIETVPMDLVSLSFWFSQNAVLSSGKRREVFLTNNVMARIFSIGDSILTDKYLSCKRCRSKIAHYNNLFAISKEGVQTSYCNSAGFIHETHTITKTLPDVVVVSGQLSNEFSWFPGYAWRYVHCAHCSIHLGWKYFSHNANIVPKTFIGLSGKSINIQTVNNENDSNHEYTDSDDD